MATESEGVTKNLEKKPFLYKSMQMYITKNAISKFLLDTFYQGPCSDQRRHLQQPQILVVQFQD